MPVGLRLRGQAKWRFKRSTKKPARVSVVDSQDSLLHSKLNRRTNPSFKRVN